MYTATVVSVGGIWSAFSHPDGLLDSSIYWLVVRVRQHTLLYPHSSRPTLVTGDDDGNT